MVFKEDKLDIKMELAIGRGQDMPIYIISTTKLLV